MCDYSLQSARSRPAKVGDKLTTRDFGAGTRGFAAPENRAVAVCVLPGTELAFSNEVAVPRASFLGWKEQSLGQAPDDEFPGRIIGPQVVLVVRSQFVNRQEDEHAEQAASEENNQDFGWFSHGFNFALFSDPESTYDGCQPWSTKSNADEAR